MQSDIRSAHGLILNRTGTVRGKRFAGLHPQCGCSDQVEPSEEPSEEPCKPRATLPCAAAMATR